MGIINVKISRYLKLELFYISGQCAHAECRTFIEVVYAFSLSVPVGTTPLAFFEVLFLSVNHSLHWSLVYSLIFLHEAAINAGSMTQQSPSHVLNVSFGHE